MTTNTRISSLVARAVVHIMLGVSGFIVRLARSVRPLGRATEKRERTDGWTVLVVGTFHHGNWFRAHGLALTKAHAIDRVIVVCDAPFEAVDNVQFACPPKWLVRVAGRMIARTLTVLRISLRERPDALMGYHFMPNALMCLVVASLVGARAIYQMTGGPIELIGGGFGCENVVLSRLGGPSSRLERLTMALTGQFDTVVVRGRKAVEFLRAHQINNEVIIVQGSVDMDRFATNGVERSTDLVCVGRLVPIKRIDRALEILRELVALRPKTRMLIVGDGASANALKDRAVELGVAGHVDFLGNQSDVERILARCKLFLLTSETEGLSIAMIEAMAAGLPAVVPDIGELTDLVDHDRTGLIINPDDAHGSARFISDLLSDEGRWQRLSNSARQAVVAANAVDAIAQEWDRLVERRSATGRAKSPDLLQREVCV